MINKIIFTKRIQPIISTIRANFCFSAICVISMICALIASPVLAEDCPPTPGNGKICTANDFNVTSAVVTGPSGCTQGDIISFTARIGLESRATERYDIGFFVGDNGEPVFDGASCSMASLVPLEPVFNALSGTGPYRNLDNDACGDVRAADGVTYRDLTLNSVLCHDSNGDDRLDVSATVTWSNNASQDVCLNPSDPASFFPNQSSKCQFNPSLNFPIIVEPPPSLAVSKLALPTSLPAPGGNVLFLVSIRNTSVSTDPLTVTSLVDDVHGNLDLKGTCSLPQALYPGQSYRCAFIVPVTGPAGYSETDTVMATAVDDEGETVSATDDATVVIRPVRASMEVVKTAAPENIPEPGGLVDYSVLVTNTSKEANLVVTDLKDNLYGDVFTKGTCRQPRSLTLMPGEYFACNFKEQVVGQPGDVITDIVTATATANSGEKLEADASAAVEINDVASAIIAKKLAIPASLSEPGGSVIFQLTVQNISPVDSVTLNALNDDVYGNLNGQGTCIAPQKLAPGAIYHCEFSAQVTGNAGDRQVDVITVTGVDDDGKPVSAQAAAEVVLTDVPAGIEVIKTASPAVLTAPGGTVSFGVTLVNTSLTDQVTISTLVDDVHGDLNGRDDCALPQTLAPAATYSCTFPVTFNEQAGFTQTDTVSATGISDDGQPVSASDSAIVQVVADPVPPAIEVVKLAIPRTLPEPGGQAAYLVQIANVSSVPVRITAIADNLYGNPGAISGNVGCVTPFDITAGARRFCRFRAAVSGDDGDAITDTVTVQACSLANGQCQDPPLTGSDDATVTITGTPATILVQKDALPPTLTEPGGAVTFTAEVRNTSIADTVTLNRLEDDIYGNLAGRGDCVLPQTLKPAGQSGDRYRCSFTAEVRGNAGDRQVDVILASGLGDDGEPVSAQDSAEVAILGALPSIALTKTANPTQLTEPGGAVTFTVTIHNISNGDTLTITDLQDSVFGNLNGRGDCAVPQTLAPNLIYQCRFQEQIQGVSGDLHIDTITLSAHNEDGESLSEQAQASVKVIGAAVDIPATSGLGLLLTSLVMGFAVVLAGRKSGSGG